MKTSWIEEINDYIEEYFPKRWTRRNIEFFINHSHYPADIRGLNTNLNLPIRNFVKSGGKRLRPVLFFTTLRVFGMDYRKYMDMALMIELLHNGTLILDDIEDGSFLRRGNPTCHVKFGLDTAVNSGASLYVMPLKYVFNRKDLSENIKLRIAQIYQEEMTNVGFGQALDIYWHKSIDTPVTVNRYLEMVRLKTGSMMRMCIRVACALSMKNGQIEELFSTFAESIGMAFQIRDDTLDLANDDIRFGKSYGNDITEGKISLPVVIALKKLPVSKASRLRAILGMHTRDKKLLKEAINLIKESGALESSLTIAKRIIRNAWSKLSIKWDNSDDLEDLRELASYFLKRSY